MTAWANPLDASSAHTAEATPLPRRSDVPSPEKLRVLLVDDEDDVRRAYARLLARGGFEVSQAANGEQALRQLEHQSFEVILSDVMMPQLGGLELLKAVRRRALETPVILLTGTPSLATAEEAKAQGALHYLIKPVDGSRLIMAATRAARLGQLARTKRQALDVIGSDLPRAGDAAGLDASLSNALSGLWLAFQPLVRANGSLFAYEVLMRSQEPALPHPGAVLTAAEQLGRMQEVGRTVRRLTVAAIAGAPAEVQLFLNLHPSDLLDEDLYSTEHPLTAHAARIFLEITERASLDAVPQAAERVKRLRSLGYRIALDDLGAGYAGLTSFATLEPEVVKLDMSLIRGIDGHAIKQKLVRSMVTTCREVGAAVVAEGIETEPELATVIGLGCDFLQGYFLGKPGPGFPKPAWPPA